MSEPTRARLLRLLEREELEVGELARVVQLPQSTVSRHLKVLHTAGWLARRSVGTANRFRFAELEADAAALWQVVRDHTDDTWTEDLARMAQVLARREVNSREFFGRHAEQWDALRRELFGDRFALPTLLQLLAPGLAVADLGCGTGEALAALAPVAERVIGVDREERMLVAARKRCAGMRNVDLRLGDFEDLPLRDAEVDAVLCMLVLHHVDGVDAALSEVRRVLRPAGVCVVLDMVAHDRTDYRHSMGHVHLGFAAADLGDRAAASGLACTGYRRLPPEPEALGPALFVATLRPAS